MNARLAVAATTGVALLAVTPAAVAGTSQSAGKAGSDRAGYTTVSVANARFTIGGERITVDLRGHSAPAQETGKAAKKKAGGSSGKAGVEHRLTGTHPELGRVTVTSRSAGEGKAGRSSTGGRATGLDILGLLTVRVEKAPDAGKTGKKGTSGKPLVLSAKDTEESGDGGRLTLKDGVYRLNEPIGLVSRDSHGRVVASIDAFPMRFGDVR